MKLQGFYCETPDADINRSDILKILKNGIVQIDVRSNGGYPFGCSWTFGLHMDKVKMFLSALMFSNGDA